MNTRQPIYLQLGSNQGDRSARLLEARLRLAELVGPIRQASAIYETAAWGITDQPDFYNQVLCMETALPPETLLHTILGIERSMGRIRDQKWGPRLIDIDILFYGELILKRQELCIPHPQIQNRRFVLVPLLEIVPDLIHPSLQLSIEELLLRTTDQQAVRLIRQLQQ